MGVDILGLAEWNLLISRRYINIHYISLLQNKKVNRKKLVFDRPSTNLVKSKACTAVSILWSENIQPTALLSYEKRHKGIVKPRHLSKEKSTKHNTTKPWYHCITNSEQFIMDLKHSHNTDISIYWKRKQISNIWYKIYLPKESWNVILLFLNPSTHYGGISLLDGGGWKK